MKILKLLSILFLAEFSYTQDIHWSQFNENPLFLNPANAGNFNGNKRFVSSYRDQWRSVTKAFQTFVLNYDTRFSKNDNFGIGFTFLNDNAGDGKFKTIDFNIAPSYRKFIAKDSSQQLNFGLQLGLNNRQFTFPNFYFDEQYNGINFDPTLPNTENLITESKTNLNLGIGVIYKLIQSKKVNYQFGFSAYNLNSPNQGFYGEKVKRDPRIVFFTIAEMQLNDKTKFVPSLIFQSQGTFKELIFGAQLKNIISRNEKVTKGIYGGLFLRTKDAIIVNIGLNYNKWQAGFSYDINISNLNPASSGRGGFELNLSYIISRFKPKQIQYRICPEFI